MEGYVGPQDLPTARSDGDARPTDLVMAPDPFRLAAADEEKLGRLVGNNLDIAIERTYLDSANQAIQSARGAFDPSLRWNTGLDNTETPTPSLIDSPTGVVAQHSAGQTLALHESTPWNGLSVDASFDDHRLTLASPFVALNPFYLSQFKLGISQPLWRGRATDAARALVTVRSRQRDVSAAELEARAMDVAARTAAAYWDLAALRRQGEVNAEAVDLARTQLDQDRRRIEAGTLASVELSASEAELQKRLDDWYRTSGAIAEQENALKTLLAKDRNDPLWALALDPADHAPPAAGRFAGRCGPGSATPPPRTARGGCPVGRQCDRSATERRFDQNAGQPGGQLHAIRHGGHGPCPAPLPGRFGSGE